SKPEPVYHSAFTGQMWVDELIQGHRQRSCESMGMASHVFQDLVKDLHKAGLCNTHHVTAEEQTAIYLH
ncbi:hypothetical protein BT96DRAFT_741438, partial [Gymnopus androsaceus JB14]